MEDVWAGTFEGIKEEKDLLIKKVSAKIHLSEGKIADGVTIEIQAYPVDIEFSFTNKEIYQEFLDILNEKMRQVWPE